MCVLAEYIRDKPKTTGDLLKGDTVAGQVSGIRIIVEDHLGRVIIAPSGGKVLAKALQQMRYEDGPRADRKYLAPLRAAHFERLADAGCPFDVASPGWPVARWARPARKCRRPMPTVSTCAFGAVPRSTSR